MDLQLWFNVAVFLIVTFLLYSNIKLLEKIDELENIQKAWSVTSSEKELGFGHTHKVAPVSIGMVK